MVRMGKWCNLVLNTEVILKKRISPRRMCESVIGAVSPSAAAVAYTGKKEPRGGLQRYLALPMIISILGWDAVMLNPCVFVEVMVGLCELVIG
jgi:hypothetical protein